LKVNNIKTEMTKNSYYLVKQQKSMAFEPAKAIDAFGDGTMFFYFIGGFRMISTEVYEFKPLIIPK